ncbi:HTH-type transcriptional regulator GltC [compost metagenome]|jgi:DNA-binding transcriptional LysR family regulator|uniref:Transcriptional regulator LysR family n=1 Tax=Cupriavidus necator (strain ATCC 43291 / DSM 13513 / CCUG 52238 / LMG 8453 / N-1) TaxID=1042878 RepID=F8GNC1_CUPNN|nr:MULTISPECIES: LysR substrate-binding domain-containing protein [Cupriavidus]RWA54658.1 LysR family transcriptional regulator [Cupriavidus sp. UYMSc13B]AEI80296.1 transcriptional regulator LysR family [Cupriavidus necator N-1]KAI3595250.1 Transcriptional regulator, LysR family [Cupriavidus necator H850]MDX6010074.1 LysR substrate-binding domain-containing protein [Cupriavidus necator]QUN30526.1 LysR family transcriptional regulator [Cupriavidus sp. KK10]
MRFDLVDLKLFTHIAEAQSLTGGAQRSHLSLAAASTRIKNLEEHVGVKLLSRSSQGVKVTGAGETLLAHARRVLRQLEQLSGDLQEYAAGVKGHVRVFANTTAMSEFLPAVLRTYLVSHPDVTIDMHERLSPDIVRAVQEGMVDIGIIAGNVRTEGLEVMPYRRDRLVLATALSHPLAERGSVDFIDTLDYDFIGLPEASAIHNFLMRAAADLQRTLRWRVQVSNFETACRMIEANVGVGVLPETTASRHAKTMALRIVQLNDEWAERKLQVCVADLGALPLFARKLVDLLVEDGLGRQD